MLRNNLFQQVLMHPASEEVGGNRLLIVSGYATPSMASYHMNLLGELNSPIEIELIVGMTNSIERLNHLGFMNRTRPDVRRQGPVNLTCRYMPYNRPVHAKVYCWLIDDTPIVAYTGSANYTMRGFGVEQVEVMESTEPVCARRFFNDTLNHSIDCLAPNVEEEVVIVEFDRGRRNQTREQQDLVTIDLSLLSGVETPRRSGINWGQREGRDPNQAYIAIPADIYNNIPFFPDRGILFTVFTDDGHTFQMKRAQENGKAIETPLNNAELGEYLRDRIGVDRGQYVTRDHLVGYGRTNVSFTRIDQDTYYMDFNN